MNDLANKHCVPCEGNMPPLTKEEAEKLLQELQGWNISQDGGSITKKFSFKDFSKTIQFVNDIAKVAEKEGHHPDLSVSYGSVVVELSTHAIGGLSENDFILAAKLDTVRS
ncbi:MAG: 4a-hydroxytetrahydrobiopterin dehydratase [Patescibacteria group bacterium]|nr:4a-hydroxytetrahydrobiopterin dehydratase [Patescibacteria group bacterium]